MSDRVPKRVSERVPEQVSGVSSTILPRALPRLISLIVPIYNEQEVLPFLKGRLEVLQSKLPMRSELILVNDGSRDASGPLLFDWAGKNPTVKVIEFARNFGHQAAVTAGLDHASGEAVVIMDGDLQDPPELIFEMLERYCEGYDIVYAQRIKRHGETVFKRATASLFYLLMRKFVHPDLPMNTGDFRLMSRDAAAAFNQLREGQRFIRGMVSWLGYHQIAVTFERPARVAGETKYPLRKMLRFAWNAILSFSSMPLKFGSFVGAIALVFGVIMAGYALIRELLYHDLVPGWPTLIIIQCVLGGTILISIGMVGEYVGRIYEELKYRPLYIVRRIANLRVRPQPARAVTPLSGQPGVQEPIELDTVIQRNRREGGT